MRQNTKIIKNAILPKSINSKNATKTPKTTNSAKQKGKIGEDKACAWLESKGFMILERNFFTRFGEIDIIALENLEQDFVCELKNKQTYRQKCDQKNNPKSKSIHQQKSAQKNGVFILHFIEVKSLERASPAYSITPKKLAKIYKSIDMYFFAQNSQASKDYESDKKSQNNAESISNLESINSLPYCVSALLIQGENISFLANVSQEC